MAWQRGSDMRAWLFSIMHNLHIDQVRRPTIATEELDDDTPLSTVKVAQIDGLEMRDLQSALATLPAEQREILLLVALEEMSYEEVATTLGLCSKSITCCRNVRCSKMCWCRFWPTVRQAPKTNGGPLIC